MKTRFITGIVGMILLIGSVLNMYVFGLAMFLLSIIAMKEYLDCFKNTVHKPIKSIAYIATFILWPIFMFTMERSIAILGLGEPDYIGCIGCETNVLLSIILYLFVVICVLMLLLMLPVVFKSDKYNISDIAITLFGIFYIPFLFSFVILTRFLEQGLYYIGMIFIGACVTDIFAYFVGCSIGKHKLLPKVSPKKTVEGSIGGIIGSVALMVLYGMYLNKYVAGINISLLSFAFLGLMTSIVSQLGDLFASAIKRYVGIKDYGSILPGHGGILDRFDSILLVAPVVYFWCLAMMTMAR